MTSAEDEFDEGAYLAANPNLAAAFAAGLIETGRAHWMEWGAAETQAGYRPALLDEAVAAANPRPVADVSSMEAALAALGGFDADAYLATNPDLAAAFGDDHAAARRHWLEYGRIEGRLGTGDAPYRDRSVSLARLLALPFGIDLHAPVLETGIEGSVGRELLAALRAAELPVSVRPYDDREDIPRLTAQAAARGPSHRITLLVGTPVTLRALHRSLPRAVFDETYVVAFAPRLALGPHMPDTPLFGMLDELWVASEARARLIASVAPVPVRHIPLPPRPLAPRAEARRLLGLPLPLFVLAIDATAPAPGGGTPRLAPEVVDAIGRFQQVADGGEDGSLLLVRASAATASLVDAGLRGHPAATFRCDPARASEGSLVFAAADAVLLTDAIAHELGGHEGRLRPVSPAAIEAVLTGDHAAPFAEGHTINAAEAGARIGALLRALGLDIPQPAFATTIGRSRTAMLPRATSCQTRPAATLPVLSLVLSGAGLDRHMLATLAAALDAQAHPYWELCIDGWNATDPRDRRAALAADPRIRLVAAPAAGPLAARWPASTGDHLLAVRDAAEAMRRIGQLAALAALIAQARAALVVRADPGASAAQFVDTIEAGGPASVPIAIARHLVDGHDDAHAAGLVLRVARTAARIACFDDAAPLVPLEPAAEELGRRARVRHVRHVLGPTASVEPGLLPATWRIRRCWPAGVRPVIRRLEGSGAIAADALRAAVGAAGAEHVVLLWDGTEPEDDAASALAELLLDGGIGAAGGCVLHADGTVAQAGQVFGPEGSVRAPGRSAPPELGGEAGAVLRVRNVDAVGGGCMAIRRSALFGLRPPASDAAPLEADAQAAALCRALRDEAGLRIVATPFARFRRRN